MSYRYLFVTVFLVMGLSACAGRHERHQEAENEFTTEIHSDGSKRFVVAIFYQQEKAGGGGGRGEGKREGKKGGGGRSGQGQTGRGRSGSQEDSSLVDSVQRSEGGSDEEKREAIMDLLEQKLAETEYCRHGFIELDYSQMRSRTELVGECQESASEQDKQRWDS
ncbi:hypothetical protein Q4574_15145 [Aliiglaciecola sp. 3_MG-2023]|uniref:hypothetical protein n=1 Tax=Aliiglaciecola sp. 3_MG-2023 TaxID=3062644 RepID=UPI0026E3F823|nr:hypothetical protein [Aliiglaciecola sp. 3_MG-2023]MDO6694631.1 hypothetical protein [Aliiglaciecola sp. 3_MG-2023]